MANMSNQSVDHALFEKTVRRLLEMIIEARRDIEILNRIVALGVSLPHAKYEEVRQQVTLEIEPSMRAIAETPADKLLELLERFEGTIQ